jgi:glycerophosphoryl diester phosphodiesterase
MVLLIAHRGASAEAPENTLSAYRRAVELGVDLIELDVRLSQDGVPVCHHDAELLDGRPVSELTYRELKDLKAGESEIPSFEAVLKLDLGMTGLMVELKEGHETGLVKAVSEFLRRFGLKKVFLGSFSLDLMRELGHYWPREQLVGIVEKEELLAEHIALKPSVIAIDIALVDPQRLSDLHQRGVQVWGWTVDDGELGKRLTQAGIDGIITNDPLLMQKALHIKK